MDFDLLLVCLNSLLFICLSLLLGVLLCDYLFGGCR